jgi:NAD(P)H-hydrate epimerase
MKQTSTCVPPKADAMVIGMGLGVTQTTEMLVSRLLSGSQGNFVLDADALAILSNWYARKQENLPVTEGQTLVLTPHAGEAARLLACKTEEIGKDRMSAAKRIVERYHAICVLKGANTIVAAPDGRVMVNTTGNDGLAKGGSGDILAGMVLSLLGQGMDAFDAACAAVFIHGLAGDMAAREKGRRGMTPQDVLDLLPYAYKEIEG